MQHIYWVKRKLNKTKKPNEFQDKSCYKTLFKLKKIKV